MYLHVAARDKERYVMEMADWEAAGDPMGLCRAASPPRATREVPDICKAAGIAGAPDAADPDRVAAGEVGKHRKKKSSKRSAREGDAAGAETVPAGRGRKVHTDRRIKHEACEEPLDGVKAEDAPVAVTLCPKPSTAEAAPSARSAISGDAGTRLSGAAAAPRGGICKGTKRRSALMVVHEEPSAAEELESQAAAAKLSRKVKKLKRAHQQRGHVNNAAALHVEAPPGTAATGDRGRRITAVYPWNDV